MVSLSKRMLMNVSMIPVQSSVADIGCDHGWVSIYLVANNLAKNVVAMDVADGPLEMARNNIREAGLEDRITVIKSDGLLELKVDNQGRPIVDTVLIAGMGGHLAMRLIEQSIDKCRKLKYLILQIQSDLIYVRERVAELGFSIEDEDMVLDEGKYYNVMRLVPVEENGRPQYSDKELRYGPVLLEKKPKVLLDYLKFKRNSFELIVNRIDNNAKSEENTDKKTEILSEIAIIDECIALF